MAAEFIAEEGVLKGLILSLTRGEEWTIGRDPDLSTIVIEDPKASRLHVRIRKTDEGYYVENLSETNPVLIGGEPVVVPTLLREGDLLTVGGSLFRFYPEGAPADYGFHAEFPYEEKEAFTEEHPFEEEEKPEEEVFEEKAPSFKEQVPEEEAAEETLFEEGEVPALHIDLTPTTRFILKVISGPNTGAEFALDLDRTYLIGTDTATCDVVFNDLSVSREHARLSVSKEGVVTIEDLNSRNGVIVDKERITYPKTLSSNALVVLGTSAFLLIDREAPAETIAAPLYEIPEEEEKEVEEAPKEEEAVAAAAQAAVAKPPRAHFPIGGLLLALIICGLAVLLGIGMVSLLQTKEIVVPQKDRMADLQSIIKQFPAVRFTYNQGTGKLFLLGHVKTGVEHNELLYQLRGLGFLNSIDDNVVNDEAVWQEMNILLSKHSGGEFKGVSMHSPEAGVFVVTGYLKTEQQASNLTDFLNINFNYLNLLQNRVVVEDAVREEIANKLIANGFEAVAPDFKNGELYLNGVISSAKLDEFKRLLDEFSKIPGVRGIQSSVQSVTPEQNIIDLNRKYQNPTNLPRYHVTGYSTRGDINVNVVINGRILSRGDCIDGYRITSIQPYTVFLEKDGLKYKIEYNKCKSFGVEE
jgi:type III secretion system YscD/HrpQ family protein